MHPWGLGFRLYHPSLAYLAGRASFIYSLTRYDIMGCRPDLKAPHMSLQTPCVYALRPFGYEYADLVIL